MRKFQMRYLKVLGSGDAFATGGKHTTSFLVKNDKEGFLIDCGVSTLVRLKQEKFPVDNLSKVFITHFHGDHYGGLPFIFISKKFQKSETPLTITGPKGIKDRVRDLQEALYPGTGGILEELNVRFMEYDQDWQQIGDISVKAYPVTHAPPSIPHGLKLKFEGHVLSFSGDTEWDDNLLLLAEEAKIFITECNNYMTDSPGHVSYKTLLEKKDLLKAERIYLSHMGQEMLELEDCEFERLKDGMEIDLW